MMTALAVVWVGWEASVEIERAYRFACADEWSDSACPDIGWPLALLRWITVFCAICLPCTIIGLMEWWAGHPKDRPPA
jgi:hypothetical protein